jgi:predicted Zn-dependent protease
MNEGDLAVERGDNEAALRAYAAAGRMQPENVEMRFWHAVSLVNMGRLQDAIPLFQDCFAQDTRWATLVPRLPASGVLNADARTIETILDAAPPR